MRSLLILLTFATLAVLANEPVEHLGGYPVYGAGMPRSGLVVPLDQAVERLPTAEAGAVKIAGTLVQVCDDEGCNWSLAADAMEARLDFGGEMPASNTESEAIVFGVLRKSSSAAASLEDDYYIVATSVLVKPED